MYKNLPHAINAAQKSTNNKFRHGALVISGKTILSQSYNSNESAFSHAELNALERCKES